MKIGELFVLLTAKSDTTSVKDFGSALSSVSLKAASMIGALAGISLKVIDIATTSIEASNALAQFEAETMLSGETLQKWGNIAERAGISAGAVSGAVVNLQRHIADIRLGRGDISPFFALGIDINKSPFAILEQMRSKMGGADRAKVINLMSGMGISPEMVRLLTLTNAQFDHMSKTGILSTQTRANFNSLREHLTGMRLNFSAFAGNLLSNVIPPLLRFFELFGKIGDFVGRNKAIFTAIGVSLTFLAACFFPVTAGLVALLLVIDDLMVYAKGGDSAFGYMVQGFKKLIEGFKTILPDMKEITGYISAFGSAFNIATAGVSGAMGNVSAIATSPFQQTNTIYVNSTAPAQDVAVAVANELRKKTDDASHQQNNGQIL